MWSKEKFCVLNVTVIREGFAPLYSTVIQFLVAVLTHLSSLTSYLCDCHSLPLIASLLCLNAFIYLELLCGEGIVINKYWWSIKIHFHSISGYKKMITYPISSIALFATATFVQAQGFCNKDFFCCMLLRPPHPLPSPVALPTCRSRATVEHCGS